MKRKKIFQKLIAIATGLLLISQSALPSFAESLNLCNICGAYVAEGDSICGNCNLLLNGVTTPKENSEEDSETVQHASCSHENVGVYYEQEKDKSTHKAVTYCTGCNADLYTVEENCSIMDGVCQLCGNKEKSIEKTSSKDKKTDASSDKEKAKISTNYGATQNWGGWAQINTNLYEFAMKNIKDESSAKNVSFKVPLDNARDINNTFLVNACALKIDAIFDFPSAVVTIPYNTTCLAVEATKSKTPVLTMESVQASNWASNISETDVVAIGGTGNSTVVKISTPVSNFNQFANITFKNLVPETKVYLYCGNKSAGLGKYAEATVSNNGTASFKIPVVSTSWVVGTKDLGVGFSSKPNANKKEGN